MAFTPVSTMANDSSPITVAKWNTEVKDNIDWIYQNAAQRHQVTLRRKTSLILPTLSAIHISWGYATVDTSDLWNATFPTRVTIPAGLGGIWSASFNWKWGPDSPGISHVFVWKNMLPVARFTPLTYGGFPGSITVYCPMDAGDYFTFGVYHSNASTITVPVVRNSSVEVYVPECTVCKMG